MTIVVDFSWPCEVTGVYIGYGPLPGFQWQIKVYRIPEPKNVIILDHCHLGGGHTQSVHIFFTLLSPHSSCYFPVDRFVAGDVCKHHHASAIFFEAVILNSTIASIAT